MKKLKLILIIACQLVVCQVMYAQWTYNNTTGVEYHNTGFVGIGTSAPANQLSVVSPDEVVSTFTCNTAKNTRITVANTTGFVNMGIGSTTKHGYLWSSTDNLFIGSDGAPTLFINGMGNGNVAIGTTDTKGYKFAVAGSAIFTKVVVKAYPWPDYVFHANYRLRPLGEVEQYINQYHHLPEVNSAEEVEKNGLDVADNQAAC